MALATMEAKFELKNKKVLVVGLGVTGLACLENLRGRTASLAATDTRGGAALAPAVEKVRAAGADFIEPDVAAGLDDVDLAILSPGLDASHPLIAALKALPGCETIGEIELAWRLMRGKLVAITGTNGKTTASMLTGALLSAAHKDVRVAGNIGEPFIGQVWDSTPETIFVLEISSYQLESVVSFAPDAAALLNVEEDHLGRHKTMEAYLAAKARMFENMNAGGLAILNGNDARCRSLTPNLPCRAALFSACGGEVVEAVWADGAFSLGGPGEAWTIPCRNGRMAEFGNRENALAALLVAREFGVDPEAAAAMIDAFRPPAHRMETVAERNGVRFVNDSKATNVAAVLAALKSFSTGPLRLILCGDDKGLDYAPLAGALRARPEAAVWFVGEGLSRVRPEMEEALGAGRVRQAADFDALLPLMEAAGLPEGATVLLSPSSSSFDRYANFEERGDDFRRAVLKWIESTGERNS